MAEGAAEIQRLKSAGFSDAEITDWVTEQRQTMSAAGFAAPEIDTYFGQKEPELTETRKYLEETIATYGFGGMPDLSGGQLPERVGLIDATPSAPQPEQPQETDFLTALNRGFGASVTGLQIRKRMPEELSPEEAKFANRIAYQIGQMTGDLPYMVGGAVASLPFAAATGPAAPAVVSGAAFAVPAGIRKAYINSLEKGEIQDLEDYLTRTAAVGIELVKGFIVGAASRGAGQVVSGTLPAVTAPVIRTTVDLGTEIATMATLMRTLEGQMPQVTDFTDAAVLLAGVKGAGKVATKLQTIYADTGKKPLDVLRDANADPAYKQAILAENTDALLATKRPTKEVSVLKPEALPEPVQPKIPDTLSDAQKEILGRVKSSEKTVEMPTGSELYTDYVDRLHPLKVFTEALGGKDVLTDKNPYELARLTAGNIGRADVFLENSVRDFNDITKKVGPGLKEILNPVREDIDAFKAYAISQRALELESRGITSGFNVEAARKVVAESKDKFDPAFKQLTEYLNQTTKYLVDSGVISKETYEVMLEANKSYVPFYRVLDDTGRPSKTVGLNVRNPVKAIRGADLDIVDPIESIVKNIYLFTDIAEKNRVMTAMVDLAAKAPEGQSFMVKADRPARPVEVTKAEIGKVLKEHGIDPAEAEAFTIFRRNGFQLGPDEVAVFRDGKREVYKVDPAIADAIKGMDQGSADLLTKIMAAPAQLLRAGVTLSPEFMARNAIRDQYVAFLQGNGYVPIFDAMLGFKDIITKSDNYYNFLMSGGANSAMVSMDRNYIKSNVLGLAKDTGLYDSTVNVIKSPIEALRVASELIENSTRVGAFRRTAGQGNTLADLYRAGFEAREVTLDFAKMGSKMKAMNMITAFFNARVQGYDKLIQTLTEKPFETTVKGVATITLPSVLLWWSNSQDPRWKDIPDWQKNLFWIVMTENNVYRIPKPFEYGLIFGSMPERMLEAYFSDRPKKELEAFGKALFESAAIDVIPTAAKPIIEQFAGKSFFTDRAIIPYDLEKQLPEYQYTPTTNLLVRKVSEGFASVANATGIEWLKFNEIASPLVMENYIRGWTGTLGPMALNLSERALVKAGVLPDPGRPEDTLADLPFVKAFVVRYPSMDAKPITEFYERYKKFEKFENTIRSQAKAGNADALEREMSLDFYTQYAVSPKGIREMMSQQARVIRNITKDPNLTPAEKRQAVDQQYYLMINTARTGVEIMDTLKDKAEGR